MDKRKNQEKQDDKAGLRNMVILAIILAITVWVGHSQGGVGRLQVDTGWALAFSCVLGLMCAWIPTIWFVKTLRNISKNTATTAAIAKENQELKEKLKSYQDDDQE